MRASPLATLVLAFASCHPDPTIQSGGFSLNKEHADRAFQEVSNRAAFELSCPREQIHLVVLNLSRWPDGDDERRASQIGVEGCGHRVVYVGGPGGGWVLNSQDKKEQ